MKNKLFFISFIIMVIYFLSAVSAADVNCTSNNVEINGENNLELSCVDEVCDSSSVCDEKSNCVNSTCDTLGAISDDLSADDECLGYVLPVVISDCVDYRELQTLIYRNSVVDLDKNYSISSDVPLKINKNITIDGHGHSIDFNSEYSASCGIKSLKGNVVLKNLIIIIIIIIMHCGVKDCGALFIDGSACCTLINCTFSHNTACKSGGAVFVNNENLLKVIDSSFNYNCAQDLGGAIYSRGSVYVINSSFYWNKAYDYGGVIYSLGRVDAINSSFTSNFAGKSYSVIRSEGVLLFKNSIASRNIVDTYKNHGDQLSSKIAIIKDDSAFMDKNIVYDELSEKILNKSVVNLWLDKSDDLEKLFKFIEDNNPSWNLLNITLAPSTSFKLTEKEFKETYNSYAVRLTIPVVKINGNPGSLIYGSDISLMYVAPTCQVIHH